MTLDVQTLLTATMASLLGLAIAMPLIMGWRVSLSARCAQATVIAQTLAWGFMLLSSLWQDRWMSLLAMICMSGGLVFQWQALRGWLGPRPGARSMLATAVAMPLGYAIGWDSYPFRVGWANALLAVQMAHICLAVAWPAPRASRRWRALVGVCMAALAVVTVWRGVLGAFFTESYPYFRAPHPVNLASALLQNVTVVLTTLGMLVAWREEAEFELQRQATTDSLTGLLTRRAFTERVDEALAESRRYGHALTLMLLDLDDFKAINDAQGHAMGDRVLELVGQALRAELRQGDQASRHGGEEFSVLLSHCDAEKACTFDDRLRRRLQVLAQAELGLAVNYSAGLAMRRAEWPTFDLWLRAADQAMYRAKAAGRGQRTLA
jgi:diguanylate cyclase